MIPSFPKLFASILGFVLIGTALVALVWEALNQLMAGHVEGRQLAIGALAAFLFAVLLRRLARAVRRWEALREEATGGSPSGRIL